MSLKILGGIAKGLDLNTPKGDETRPTTVMLKRKLFDSWQNLAGYRFIDLCAGTGQVGLEALSRGAFEVYLIEKSPKSFQLCKSNIAKFDKFTALGNATAVKSDYLKWLKAYLNSQKNTDDLFIFFDPPYEMISSYEVVFDLLKSSGFKGHLVFEACQQKTMRLAEFETKFPGAIKCFKQGTSFFNIYSF